MSDQNPATPVEAENAEPVVEPQIAEYPTILPEPVEPTVEEEEEQPEDQETEFTATDLAYWKKFSRDNENAKNKALKENKALKAELDALKSEINAVKFENTVTNVLSEYKLSDDAREFLTASEPEALKAQALKLVKLFGGTAPATTDIADVVAEPQRFINPLAGLSDVGNTKPLTFDERLRARLSK